MNKKFIAIIILILFAVGGYFIAKKYQNPVQPAVTPISTPTPAALPDSKEAEYQKYLVEAMGYRTAGFQGDKTAFYKAIDSYKKAVEISEGKVWVPYLNLGNTYRLVEDYINAEDAYDKALEITAGEGLIYLAKIEMYKHELKKTNAEIGAVYEESLKNVAIDNINLIISYAAFLRNIGKYSDALENYKILAERYPDNQAYKDEIAELQNKIK